VSGCLRLGDRLLGQFDAGREHRLNPLGAFDDPREPFGHASHAEGFAELAAVVGLLDSRSSMRLGVAKRVDRVAKRVDRVVESGQDAVD
jgi:hypothetical protein